MTFKQNSVAKLKLLVLESWASEGEWKVWNQIQVKSTIPCCSNRKMSSPYTAYHRILFPQTGSCKLNISCSYGLFGVKIISYYFVRGGRQIKFPYVGRGRGWVRDKVRSRECNPGLSQGQQETSYWSSNCCFPGSALAGY